MTSKALTVLFVACTMAANIMSLRMVEIAGIVTDAGALIYPITFVIRDALHRKAGLKESNAAITLSAVCSACMFALFALTASLPADLATGPQEEFGRVLLPGVLIVVGSVAGQFVSERVDGRIYHAVAKGERFTLAALVSNIVSIPLDSVIVCVIAFSLTVPVETLVSVIFANIGIKYAMMLIFVVGMAANDRRAKKA